MGRPPRDRRQVFDGIWWRARTGSPWRDIPERYGPRETAYTLFRRWQIDAAVVQLRADGHDIKDEDIARLSPLKDRHINFLGRYLFNIKASGPGQGLRPFRDPDAPEDTDDGD